MSDVSKARWRRRFLAARITLPSWGWDEPDRLLYASNASGKWELYAWDRRADAHRQVTDRPEGTVAGALDPSGRTIWWFDDTKGDEFGRWMTEPFDGGSPPVPAAPDLPAAYGAGLSLGVSAAALGSSTAAGSAVHLLQSGRSPLLLYEHREDARVAGLSRDGELICLSHSEHGDSRHPALRALGRDGAAVGDLWDGPGLGLSSAGWSLVPGDRRVLVLHERRDLPRPMVWWPETGETLDLDVDLPGEVDASWYPDGRAILLAHDHRGRVELYRMDLSTGALEDLGVEPGSVSSASARPDGDVWYAWNRSSSPTEIRGASGLVLRAPGESAPMGVAYTDHDVAGVHVFEARPAAEGPEAGRSAATRWPTIFVVHGGPEWHDRDAFSPYVQAWVDHGFVVLLVNYRGSTGYGKAWRDALEGEPGPGLTELEDLATVRDWAVDSGLSDPDRTILSGGSWGGYLTLLGLGVQPERWSLGIAAVPVADYVAAYEDEMEPLKAFDSALMGGSPEEIPGRYGERSPITFADRLAVPVLILAGENDPRCPIRQVENYLARLRELGKAHDVYRFDAGHGSMVIEETIRQTEAELAFAARRLGTPPPL